MSRNQRGQLAIVLTNNVQGSFERKRIIQMTGRKKRKKPQARNWRNSRELMKLRQQRTQGSKTKQKKTKGNNGVFPMTDEQRRRANHEGVEHVLSRGERRRLEKKLEAKRREKAEKLREQAKDAPIVRQVVLGGAPSLGKRRR